MDMKLEVVVIPVSDVDRAKEFYGDIRVPAGYRPRRSNRTRSKKRVFRLVVGRVLLAANNGQRVSFGTVGQYQSS